MIGALVTVFVRNIGYIPDLWVETVLLGTAAAAAPDSFFKALRLPILGSQCNGGWVYVVI